MNTANEAYQALYDAGRKPESILLRAGFVARKKPLYVEGDRDQTERPKPPAARLIRSRGVALRLELALIFARQCSKKTGARTPPIVAPDDEYGLVNLFATGTRRKVKDRPYLPKREQMRAGQIQNALDILAGLQLIDLGVEDEDRSPYDAIWLNNEAGPVPGKDPVRYAAPAAADPVISIPTGFFTNGWIQVLTDSEIWNWLAFRHQGKLSSPASPPATGVRIDAVTRLSVYDLTRDAWDTHLMLDRYGLMTAIPGEITSELTQAGQQRFRKEPHEFDLDDKVLQQDGHAAVTAAVAAVRDDLLDQES